MQPTLAVGTSERPPRQRRGAAWVAGCGVASRPSHAPPEGRRPRRRVSPRHSPRPPPKRLPSPRSHPRPPPSPLSPTSAAWSRLRGPPGRARHQAGHHAQL